MGRKNCDESRREFLKKVLKSSFMASAGLFLGSKDLLANIVGNGGGVCSTSYSCSGGRSGRGQCSSSMSCSGGGGACSSSMS